MLLCVIGLVEWVEDEGLIDVVIVVLGLGLVYVFLLVEELVCVGVEVGFFEVLVMKLVCEIVVGFGELLY